MPSKIDLELSFSGIERAYAALTTTPTKVDVALPNLIDMNIGLQSHIIQFLNTWIRKTISTSILKTSISNKKAEIEGFIRNPIGLCAILMMYKNGRKLISNSNVDITFETAEAGINHLASQAYKINDSNKKIFPETASSVNVFCFDHSSIQMHKYNWWFYQQEKLLDEKQGFRAFYNASIACIMSKENSLKKIALNESIAEKVTGIIKELIENTDEHARTGFGVNSSNPLIPNMRGILITLHKGDYAFFKSKVTLGDPFDMYFSNPLIFNNKHEIKTFLEISVIDSGPGFAQKASKRALSTMTKFVEKEIISECLSAYQKDAKHQGLKRIGAYLSLQRGFIKIRTGRLSLYRNYIVKGQQSHEHGNYREKEMINDSLRDWYNDGKKITSLATAAGSLINIIYPIEIRK